MKKVYSLFVLLLPVCGATAQVINFPDAAFKAKLVASTTSNGIAKNNFGNSIKVDINSNGEIEVSEALAVVQLNVATNILTTTNDIVDLSGIENFTNLKVLNCSGNQIASINVNALTQLEELKANDNLISSASFSAATGLKKINFNHNLLTSISTDNLVSLTELFAYDNHLASISFSNNPLLENLNIRTNSLTSLDVSVLPSLKWVSCDDNDLASLTLTGLLHIDEVECGNNLLTSLNLNGLTTLRILGFNSNQISSINLSGLSTLNMLNISNNPISNLNLSGLSNLGLLTAGYTLLTAIDCSQVPVTNLVANYCPNLQTINVRNGIFSMSDPDLLFYAFIIHDNPNLVSICTDDGEQNQLGLYPYTYNTSGSVVVYNGVNCDVPVQVNAGITDLTKATVKLYPNPSSDIVNIEVSDNQTINKVAVNNVLGQTIMTFGNTTTLDISSLSKGTYFITVETEVGKDTQRIIKL